MEDKKQLLQNWLNLVSKKLSLYDYEKNKIECEKALIDFYTNDKDFKNLDIVKTIMCRMALFDGAYFERYIEFLEKESYIDSKLLPIYKKVLYAYIINSRIAPIDKDFSYDLIEKYKKKFNNIYIPYKFPNELYFEKEPLATFIGTIKGYEKKWKKKAIKNREKASKFISKYENGKAADLLKLNLEKFGDVYSAKDLGDLYKKLGDNKEALKYYKIGKEYGSKDSYENYYKIFYSINYEEFIDLADSNRGSESELKYLLEAFKYDKNLELVLRIAKLLLKPNKSYTNIELGTNFLNCYFNSINTYKFDNYENFIAYYSEILTKGEGIEKNLELACFCGKSLKSNNKSIDELTKKVKETLLEAIIQKVSIDINSLAGPSSKPLANIYELGNDYNDFYSYQRPNETISNFKNRIQYFKEACESDNENIIINKLTKAAKLGHSKAMVALYYYYADKCDWVNAYYYIFEAECYINQYRIKDEIFNNLKINIIPLLDCLYKYNQYNCKCLILEHIDLSKELDNNILTKIIDYSNKGNMTFKVWLYEYYSKFDAIKSIDVLDELKEYKDLDYNEFITQHVDFTKDIPQALVERLEYYSSKGNMMYKVWLNEYYTKHNSDKLIDNLYELATWNPIYIHRLIEAKGGFNPIFDEKFVKFIFEFNNSRNKYVMYLRALLCSNKELCKKYKLINSDEEVFKNLYLANQCQDLGFKDLDIKVKYWLTKCYEFGIGTKMDLKEASELLCRDGGNSVELGYFSKYCLPQIYKLDNFHNIKEYFLNHIKVKDYESTFDEIKRFINANFKLNEIFKENGEYLGKIMHSKLVEREKQIQEEILERIRKAEEERKKEELKRQEEIKRANELKRQEEIKRANELKRQEEIKRANELKRQEEIKRANELKRQEEIIKKEQEKIKIEEVKKNPIKEEVKISDVSKPANNKSISSSSTSKSTSISIKTPLYYCPINSENQFYKELNPDPYSRIIDDEKKAIASLRQHLNYPNVVEYPGEYDGFVRLSKAKRDKLYIQATGRRKIEIDKYCDRLFDLENPFKKYGVNNFRRELWNLSDNARILNAKEFAEKVEKEFNSKSKIGSIKVTTSSYKYKDREAKTSNYTYLVERILTHTPIYASEITLNITVDLVYERSNRSDYFDVVNEIESLYDKTSLSRGDIYDLKYENMRDDITEALNNDINRDKEEKFRASLNAEKVIERFVQSMFEQYVVFAGKYIEQNSKKQYIEGLVKKVKIEYKIR